MSFEFPPVKVGDRIEVFPGLNADRGFIAYVSKVAAGRAVDAQIIAYVGEKRGLRHKDDPLLKDRPDLVAEAGGVFGLCSHETRVDELAAKVDELTALIKQTNEFVTELAAKQSRRKE